jgi:lysophospholipase L1-like esterase
MSRSQPELKLAPANHPPGPLYCQGQHSAADTKRPVVRIGFKLIIAILISILIAEGLLRLTVAGTDLAFQHDFVDDPHLPFKPVPESAATDPLSSEFQHVYEHNSLGLRDEEHETEKKAGVFRVLAIGDGFTYGQGAPFDSTYPALLERKLNSRQNAKTQVEIIKAGVPRYYPEPERILLEHYGLRFSPDLILAAFTPNDILDTHIGTDAVTIEAPPAYLLKREVKLLGQAGDFLYRKVASFRILWQHFVSQGLWKAFRHPPERGLLNNPDALLRAWTKIEAEFGEMAKLARRHQAQIVFIHIPGKGPWSKDAAFAAKRLSEWCRANTFRFIDTLPALEEASRSKPTHWPQNGHCTPAGYKAIADAVFANLIDWQLVPEANAPPRPVPSRRMTKRSGGKKR